VVLGTGVRSVTGVVSEPGAVTTGATAAGCVVVSVVGCATTGGGVPMEAGPWTELAVGVCRVAAAEVEESGCRSSVGLMEVTQKSAVTAEGAPLVLDVMAPAVELAAAGGASVALTGDSDSSTSGLTAGGAVGGDGGPDVLEGSAAGWVSSSGAGGAPDEVLTTGLVVVVLLAGRVEDPVVGVVWRRLVEAAVLVVVAEVTEAEDGVTGSTATGPLMPEARPQRGG